MTESKRRQLIVQPIEAAHPDIGRSLWMIEDARRRTMGHLGDVDPMIVDWKPECSLHSLGTLLYHIAAIELDWLHTDVLQQPFPSEIDVLFSADVRDDVGKLTVIRGESLDQLLSRLTIVRSHLLDVYRAMSLEDFHRARALPEYDMTPEWTLHHLCQHEAEHRAEIASLQTQFKYLAKG